MPATIGQQLKKARLEQHLTLKQAFESTHIRIKYLEALEADDFSVMPSAAQGRGFLRLYAQYLGLEIDQLLDELRRVETDAAAGAFTKIEETGPVAGKDEETEDEETDEGSAPQPEGSFWTRLLRRAGVPSRPDAEPDPVPEAESAPETEADPGSAPDAEPEPESTPDENSDPEPAEPPKDSRVIFNEIGAELRQRREMLSLTYKEIERHTHVRAHYLRAMEAGDFDNLPSSVQTHGMLNNYAVFLDLDAEALLLRFADGLQAQRLERHPTQAEGANKLAQKRNGKHSLRSFVAPDLIFGIGMVVLLIAFGVWGVRRIAASQAEPPPEAAAPSISQVLLATPTMTLVKNGATPTLIVNTPSAGNGTPVAFDAPPEEKGAGVQVHVVVVERTWMRVTVDGKVVFEGRVQPGSAYPYEGEEQIEILTGNAAGLRVTYNQRDMGLMGNFGEVINRVYSPKGILTPTATPTLTGTPTPLTTPTPSPTATATPTEVQGLKP